MELALAIYSHETSCQKYDGIDDSNNPFVSPWIRMAICIRKTKFRGKRQIGPIGSSLIPSLRGGSDGTQTDRIPKHERAVPFVVPLVCERTSLLFIKFSDHLESVLVTCDKSSSAEQSGVLGHIMRLGKSPGIDDGLLRGGALWVGRGSASMITRGGIGPDIATLTFRGFSTILRATDLRRSAVSASSGCRASVALFSL